VTWNGADQAGLSGSRRDRLRSTHSYGIVLLLVLVAICTLAAAPDEHWTWVAFVILQAAILQIALWTSGLGAAARRSSILITVLVVVLAALQLLWTATEANGIAGILNALIIVATCVVIAIGVIDQGTINAQSVLGVVTVYLLLGLFFCFAFSVVAVFGDGPFFAQGTDGTVADRLYFSYVTIATLGYGDLTPADTPGRMLAVAEAIFGQLYLVTIVAVVVSRLRPRSNAGGPDTGSS
jgi:hypothetical protein